MLALMADDIISALQGSAEVTTEQIANVSDPKELPKKFVRFKIDGVVPTGVSLMKIHKRSGEKWEDSKYVMLNVKDKYLLSMLPTGPTPTKVEGELRFWKSDGEFLAKGPLADFFKKNPAYQAQLLPFQFNASNDLAGSFQWILGFFGLLALIGIALLAYEIHVRKQLRKFNQLLAARLGENSNYVVGR